MFSVSPESERGLRSVSELREPGSWKEGGRVRRSASLSRPERTTMVVRLHTGDKQKISPASNTVRNGDDLGKISKKIFSTLYYWGVENSTIF